MFASPAFAAESYSSLFIKITDATTAVKNGDQARAKELVSELKTEFSETTNHDSKAGKKVSQALEMTGEVTEEKLTTISARLLDFEKEQNPVDVNAEKKKLQMIKCHRHLIICKKLLAQKISKRLKKLLKI